MASRKLKIMYVAKTKVECENLVTKTIARFQKLSSNINVSVGVFRVTQVPDHRCEMYFEKASGIKWDEYYKAVNSVKPVPFDFLPTIKV
jgi:hypothetical protein